MVKSYTAENMGSVLNHRLAQPNCHLDHINGNDSIAGHHAGIVDLKNKLMRHLSIKEPVAYHI